MGCLVVKLGSSIVVDERGEPRLEVLAGICDQLVELHRTARDPVVVTSGAIARGMGVRGIPLRPRAIDELQAASAVGQGKLYQVYDELLRARGVPTAQVLLTFFDMSARTHYLNARQTLRKLLDWRVLPVINENDTTATDEISFGNNDFLAAQVAILLGAELLLLLTDADPLFQREFRKSFRQALLATLRDARRCG
jgi:glutamate 5-kinase